MELDAFWGKRLPQSRKGTRWEQVLFVLAAYRLLAPGSEWRLHREWFERSAMADLLGDEPGWRRSTSSIAVTTGCSIISQLCSSISSVAGAISLTPASPCFSPT